jgi:hypothetical protein
MRDRIERQKIEADAFDDELSDEALDRPAETASSSSCFTAGRPCTSCFVE